MKNPKEKKLKVTLPLLKLKKEKVVIILMRSRMKF